jgi:undecaprenyl-diphosphatase
VIAAELAAFDARRAAVLGLSFLPPAIAGFALERQIERRLGGPRATAIGLLAGALAMVIADRHPQVRGRGEAGAADGLALGVAQAAALAPGVSRTVALPVIVGATVLKSVRLRRRGLSPHHRRAFAAGTAASFVSTLSSQALIGQVERDRALWPYAAYRAALAAVVLTRLGRRSESRRREPVQSPRSNRVGRWARAPTARPG